MNSPLKTIASVLHPLFFVVVISGIFWMQWLSMAIIFATLRLQDKLLGGCILTKLEFGSYKDNWSERYWKKYLNIDIPRKRWSLYVDWILPSALIFLTFLIQS